MKEIFEILSPLSPPVNHNLSIPNYVVDTLNSFGELETSFSIRDNDVACIWIPQYYRSMNGFLNQIPKVKKPSYRRRRAQIFITFIRKSLEKYFNTQQLDNELIQKVAFNVARIRHGANAYKHIYEPYVERGKKGYKSLEDSLYNLGISSAWDITKESIDVVNILRKVVLNVTRSIRVISSITSSKDEVKILHINPGECSQVNIVYTADYPEVNEPHIMYPRNEELF